jgi:tryptophan-rich hypothetical protein
MPLWLLRLLMGQPNWRNSRRNRSLSTVWVNLPRSASGRRWHVENIQFLMAQKCGQRRLWHRCLHLMNPPVLLTKSTSVKPVAKQKHFGVSRVIQPDDSTAPIEQVEIEAVFSKATQVIAWRDLQGDRVWRQGWVGFCTYSIQVYFVALGSGKPTTRPTNSKKAETALGS